MYVLVLINVLYVSSNGREKKPLSVVIYELIKRQLKYRNFQFHNLPSS